MWLWEFVDRVYSIHFAATALLHVDKTATAGEQVICGFEALLAIGMRSTRSSRRRSRRTLTENALADTSHNGDGPLPLSSVETVSLGPARGSTGVGVYAARKQPKVIFGQTTQLGFAARLGEKIYSSAHAVVACLGGTFYHAVTRWSHQLMSQTRTSASDATTSSSSRSMRSRESTGLAQPGARDVEHRVVGHNGCRSRNELAHRRRRIQQRGHRALHVPRDMGSRQTGFNR